MPLVVGSRAGPYSIQLPRGRRTVGARPLSWAPKRGHVPSNSGGGMGAVRAPMCPRTPCMTPLHHVPRTRRTEGARPLPWAPKRGHIQSITGGGGCSTGPHVPSNPLHDPVAPRAKDTPNQGSAPLVMGPQAGPYSIHSRGGRGAVRAPMCPLTPCMIPATHVPRGRRTVGAHPLSWAPKQGHVPSNSGGEWVQYGPPCAL